MSDPLDIASALVRMSFLVQSVYARVCAERDLTPAQAQLLCIVRARPRSMSELASTIGLEKSSLSGLVDRAERRGFVFREVSQADRRAFSLVLTARGREVADSFHREATRALERLAADVPADESQCLSRALGRILSAEAVPEVFGGSGR